MIKPPFYNLPKMFTESEQNDHFLKLIGHERLPSHVEREAVRTQKILRV